MDFLMWLLIVLVVVVALGAAFAFVQAKRRAGGVIASRGSRGTGSSG